MSGLLVIRTPGLLVVPVARSYRLPECPGCPGVLAAWLPGYPAYPGYPWSSLLPACPSCPGCPVAPPSWLPSHLAWAIEKATSVHDEMKMSSGKKLHHMIARPPLRVHEEADGGERTHLEDELCLGHWSPTHMHLASSPKPAIILTRESAAEQPVRG